MNPQDTGYRKKTMTRTLDELTPLLQAFPEEERRLILEQAARYDRLLARLPMAGAGERREKLLAGILALNGASGAGQSYVMKRVARLLEARSITLPRIYLLATRKPRPDEGYKNPYIFVEAVEGGWRDIYHPETVYRQEDIYYRYQSRPGAENAILLSDARLARERIMYLETVIPTLLHIREHTIKGIPAWKDNLRIVYLAAPDGYEWVYRLLNRETGKLVEEGYRRTLLGRLASSLDDMELAAEHRIPCVLNHYGKAEQAAEEILSVWGLGVTAAARENPGEAKGG